MSSKIVIISGSPKAPGKAVSDILAKETAEALQELRGAQPRVINIRRTLSKHHTEQAFAEMAQADALIIIFPLYVFCLPGITMRFLQQYKAYADSHPEAKGDMSVYAVVNCGFPEPEINGEAVQVISRFAGAIGARFRCGVMIGGGGMLGNPIGPTKKKLKEYRGVVRRIGEDITANRTDKMQDILLDAPISRKLYFTFGNIGWKWQIRKNGKKSEELYAKPYQPTQNT